MKRNHPASLCILLFMISTIIVRSEGGSYTSSSVLSAGQWLKIAITEDGVYRIDYSTLKQKGLSDPANPRIFCNNAGQLSYYNNGPVPDDLKEMAIYLSSGSDGVFNEGDYLLFYGMKTHRWIFNQSSGSYSFLRHNYSDTAFYFLTSGPVPGKKITTLNEPAQAPDFTSTASDAFYSYEYEKVSIIKSGRDWFQKVSPTSGIKFNTEFTDLILSERIRYWMRVAARSSTSSVFTLNEGTMARKEMILPGINLFNTTGIQAAVADSGGFMPVSASSPSYEVRYNTNNNPGATGWLDFVRMQARVRNVFRGKITTIMDSRSVAGGRITEFTLESQDNVIIWDVTDPFNNKIINYRRSGNNLSFTTESDSLHKFVAFNLAGAGTPDIRTSPVPNQDLHSSPPADMIILVHPLFRKHAEELADIHLENSGLTCNIATIHEVYNEFSGGVPDIAALRNFVRMKYLKQKGTSKPLKYLLLFGDGSFENKTPPGNPPKANPNFVPTYQSKNSNVIVSSFTSDDFYGLLDDGEGEAEGTEDIGIGRLPVTDTIQAGIMLTKIRRYLDPVNMGDWRNVICLTADDEDGNAHMSDAEGLELVLKQKAPQYQVEKIYLDAFKQNTAVNGQSYPDVTKAVNNRINSGCLIFNYTGHGNEAYLAQEEIINTEDYFSWKNGGRLPLFITATCEFSRFDDVEISVIDDMSEKRSAGEMILLAPEGGAIALMSTTRVVFSAPNFFLNRNIFNYAFERDNEGNPLRLGDIIRIAKNNSGSGSNKRNFSLLGDPALRLAYPWHGKVVTDSINHVAVAQGADSLKALSLVTVSGHIEDPEGNNVTDFDGIVSPVVYDKESSVRTLANDGGPVMEFKMRNNILFSGQTKAKEGRFRFSFIVPRDINYSFGKGKISYYAHDDSRNMNGSFNDVIVGGFAGSSVVDTSGPVIRLFLNDTLFRYGGIAGKNPVLLALIEDPGGINTTGSGIGHDLTGSLDEERNGSIVLNNYYVNDFDNYRKGKIMYSIFDLAEGSHSFTVKAWDNFNNSSEETIRFVVGDDGKFIIKDLFNYPNPFTSETSISAQMNRSGEMLDITLNIISLNGKIIRSLRTSTQSSGYVLPPILWDGLDEGGNRVVQGMYPYTITIRTESGETARASGRMIIL